MTDFWRLVLYFPLGILPAFFFGSRFIYQWIKSERLKTSTITPFFWKLSLIGNLLFILHYIIQVQFPFAIIQTINAVIAWRNLNLMSNQSKKNFKFTLLVMVVAITTTTTIFLLQSYFFIGYYDFIRTPKKFLTEQRIYHPPYLHVLGTISGAVFASRFWLQWYQAEKKKQSELGQTFWWLSIIGSVLSIFYFFRIYNLVSLFNQCFGIIPYARNLILINKQKKSSKSFAGFSGR